MCVHWITLDLGDQEAQAKYCYMHFTQEATQQWIYQSVSVQLSRRNQHKIRHFSQKLHVCELAPKSLNRHQWCQLTDTDLMRSSITLLVILVNLDKGCHLSDKPACRSVTRAESSQVKGTVSLCRYKYHTTKANTHLKNLTTTNIL